MKLCVIYNFAAHYRAPIFVKIDQSFDCDWCFGDRYDDVKKMDYSLLRGKVYEVSSLRLPGGLIFRPGIQRLLGKDYDTYLLLGESRVLSTWLFCVRARLFYPHKRLYFWSHGWYGKETKIEGILKKWLFLLPNGGVFLYNSHAKSLMIKEGFNPDRLYVIHNSLDYDRQLEIRKQLVPSSIYQDHFGNSHPNLFFVGRLTKVKRLDMVLMAMSILRNKGNRYNMTFIGNGTELDALKSLAEELNLSKNVWFYGACYNENLLGEMIYNADLCVAPGNIGLTAMHSLVFGTPAITHNDFTHQMPEYEAIHDGETGTFFECGSIISLAEGIARWFDEHRDDRKTVRQACMREIDDNWTPNFQIQVLKNILLK